MCSALTAAPRVPFGLGPLRKLAPPEVTKFARVWKAVVRQHPCCAFWPHAVVDLTLNCLESGVDFYDTTSLGLSIKQVATVQECRLLCKMLPTCNFFSWTVGGWEAMQNAALHIMVIIA